MSLKSPLYIELVHPYHFGNKVPQFVCKVYARAVIVTLGLGRPKAAENNRHLYYVKIYFDFAEFTLGKGGFHNLHLQIFTYF